MVFFFFNQFLPDIPAFLPYDTQSRVVGTQCKSVHPVVKTTEQSEKYSLLFVHNVGMWPCVLLMSQGSLCSVLDVTHVVWPLQGLCPHYLILSGLHNQVGSITFIRRVLNAVFIQIVKFAKEIYVHMKYI